MLREKLYELKNWNEVQHTTFNPGGPGAVRIHMIPPKFHPFRMIPSIVILNGQDYIPLNESWGILLSEFIKVMNDYGEQSIDDETLLQLLSVVFQNGKKVYHNLPQEYLENDLDVIDRKSVV